MKLAELFEEKIEVDPKDVKARKVTKHFGKLGGTHGKLPKKDARRKQRRKDRQSLKSNLNEALRIIRVQPKTKSLDGNEKEAQKIISRAREIAQEKDINFPQQLSHGGSYGSLLYFSYRNRDIRQCIQQAIDELKYKII